jgi:hypothetical protein
MKKFLVLLLVLCFCLGVLTACGNDKQSETNNTETIAETTETQDPPINLSESYSLDTDKILIVTDYDITQFEPWKMKTIEITDPEKIAKVQESVKFTDWVDHGDDMIEGFCYCLVIFNDNVTMRFYDGIKDCYIGSYEITEEGVYKFKSAGNRHLYNVSSEFTQLLRGYCEQYDWDKTW